MRDRIGRHKDRFFATVFLGSGLLFVAMLFVSSVLTAGFLANAAVRPGAPQEVSGFGRRIGAVLHIYAMRMAAVFTISTATIGLRTGVIPRWLGFCGYAIALVLLLVIGVTPRVELLFPYWILLLSIDNTLVESFSLGRVGAPPVGGGRSGVETADAPDSSYSMLPSAAPRALLEWRSSSAGISTT